jgi:hypothetical protein
MAAFAVGAGESELVGRALVEREPGGASGSLERGWARAGAGACWARGAAWTRVDEVMLWRAMRGGAGSWPGEGFWQLGRGG